MNLAEIHPSDPGPRPVRCPACGTPMVFAEIPPDFGYRMTPLGWHCAIAYGGCGRWWKEETEVKP